MQTRVHTHTRVSVYARSTVEHDGEKALQWIVAVAGRKGGICLTTSLLYNLPRGNGGGGGSAVYD